MGTDFGIFVTGPSSSSTPSVSLESASISLPLSLLDGSFTGWLGKRATLKPSTSTAAHSNMSLGISPTSSTCTTHTFAPCTPKLKRIEFRPTAYHEYEGDPAYLPFCTAKITFSAPPSFLKSTKPNVPVPLVYSEFTLPNDLPLKQWISGGIIRESIKGECDLRLEALHHMARTDPI